jgi:hypothetical protein
MSDSTKRRVDTLMNQLKPNETISKSETNSSYKVLQNKFKKQTFDISVNFPSFNFLRK